MNTDDVKMSFSEFKEIERKNLNRKHKEWYSKLSDEKKKEMVSKEKKCEICNLSVKINDFTKHLHSKCHIDNCKLKNIAVPEKEYVFCEKCQKNVLKHNYKAHLKTKRHIEGKKEKKNYYCALSKEQKTELTSKMYFCKCCNVTMAQTNKSNHRKTKKHALNEEKHNKV